MPMRMIDGAVVYDEVHNVFVITGIPRSNLPVQNALKSRSGVHRQKVRPGIHRSLSSFQIGGQTNCPSYMLTGVVIYLTRPTIHIHDVTSAGFSPASHTNGGFVYSDGNICIRIASNSSRLLVNNGSRELDDVVLLAPVRSTEVIKWQRFLKDDFTGSGNISAHAVSGSGAVGGAWVTHPASAGELQLDQRFPVEPEA